MITVTSRTTARPTARPSGCSAPSASATTAGENIAMGYAAPAAVVAGWMNSEGHRANILSSAYTKIGVGYVADGHYWTQQFIG